MVIMVRLSVYFIGGDSAIL